MNDDWNAELYQQKHSFVWQCGIPLVDLLAPQSGERILDLGCGTGQLTEQVAASGANVIGLDRSPDMIREARRLYPHLSFREGDADNFDVADPLDAIFSNATLHWITRPDATAQCIARALKPNGRLVVEFGGRGNVRHLARALEAASKIVHGQTISHPWYFPGISEFAGLLERHGLEVTEAALIDRPTALDGDDGLRNWVQMFGGHWLTGLPFDRRMEFLEQVETIARPSLFQKGVWFADYRRLRVVALKGSSTFPFELQ
jgi:trans-aconitate 2-methyltransferase